MKSSTLRPEKLDVAALALSGEPMGASLPWAKLPRLAASCLAGPQNGEAGFSAQGQMRHRAGAAPEPCLHLTSQVEVSLLCQRCLQPARLPLNVDSRFRFVADEARAEAEDELSDEEDVLALPRYLNLVELLEDELILALPIVPRHELCAPPAPLIDSAAEAEMSPAPHAFAALAALKPKPG